MECCDHTNCLSIPILIEKNERKDKNGTVEKLSSEQQFHKSDAVTLAQPGLTAGWQADWLAG